MRMKMEKIRLKPWYLEGIFNMDDTDLIRLAEREAPEFFHTIDRVNAVDLWSMYNVLRDTEGRFVGEDREVLETIQGSLENLQDIYHDESWEILNDIWPIEVFQNEFESVTDFFHTYIMADTEASNEAMDHIWKEALELADVTEQEAQSAIDNLNRFIELEGRQRALSL